MNANDETALVERLRAKRESDLPRHGSGSVSSDGKVTMTMQPPHMVLVNPDGLAAADAIERLAALSLTARGEGVEARYYGEDDRERAIAALFDSGVLIARGSRGEIIDKLAEALGLQFATRPPVADDAVERAKAAIESERDRMEAASKATPTKRRAAPINN